MELNAKGCILYQRYKGKTQDGQDREGKRRIGCYVDRDKAIKSYLELIQLKKIPDTLNSLPEYIGAVKTANKAIVEEIKRLLDDKCLSGEAPERKKDG